MRFKRAVLAWEIGAGRGHIVRLNACADALASLGIACTAAVLIRTQYAHEIAGRVERVHQAPPVRFYWWHRKDRNLSPPSTYGEWLGDNGLAAGDYVLARLAAWRAIFEEEKPDLVVCDQGPYAILAARSLGIATAATGNWFSTPPSHFETYPPLPYREHIPYWSEAQMVDAVNAALAAFGGLRLKHLPQIYDCDVPLCASLDVLDFYGGQRRVPLVPAVTPSFRETGGPHDEVFVYYSVDERFDPVMLTAIMSLPMKVRAFIPGCEPEIAGLLRARGVIVEEAPVPADDLVGRTRVFVHAGPQGTVSLGLRAGIPFVAAPRMYETEVNSRQCADLGVAIAVLPNERTVPTLRAAIFEIYESSAYHERARAMAARLAPQFAREPAAVIAERIAAVIH
jgi:hypothetical protein